MKNNNKGFTLIELLAVVVIMLAISVMAVSSISAAIERNKNKQNSAKIKVIESAAEIYYNDHKNSLSGVTCINLKDLTDLSEEEKTDADGETFGGYISINNGKVAYVEGDCS